MIKITKFNPRLSLKPLNDHLNTIAEKHDIEEPFPLMLTTETIFDYLDKEEEDE